MAQTLRLNPLRPSAVEGQRLVKQTIRGDRSPLKALLSLPATLWILDSFALPRTGMHNQGNPHRLLRASVALRQQVSEELAAVDVEPAPDAEAPGAEPRQGTMVA